MMTEMDENFKLRISLTEMQKYRPMDARGGLKVLGKIVNGTLSQRSFGR